MVERSNNQKTSTIDRFEEQDPMIKANQKIKGSNDFQVKRSKAPKISKILKVLIMLEVSKPLTMSLAGVPATHGSVGSVAHTPPYLSPTGPPGRSGHVHAPATQSPLLPLMARDGPTQRAPLIRTPPEPCAPPERFRARTPQRPSSSKPRSPPEQFRVRHPQRRSLSKPCA